MTRADDLFALVVANLADNAPRAVLADHWMELGDPRGEFVALQLKVNRGEGNRTDRERMTQLKQRHETEWLGALRSVAGFALFQRGFLDEVHLVSTTTARTTPDAIAEAAQCGELGTVRFLRRRAMTEETYRAFLFSPALVNVRSADVPLDLLYEVLAHPPATLRRLALESSTSIRLDEHVDAVQRILAGARFEEVAVSVSSGEDIRPYFRALLPLATETTSVVVSTQRFDCRTTRSAGGLVLHVPKRDRRLVAVAREAVPDARLA